MKEELNVFDHATEIMNALKTGVLLTTKAHDRVNSMTISWGSLGIEFGRPLFTTFVREHRFTKGQLDENPEFTINVPMGDFDRKILSFCGSNSGRDVDKPARLGLTLETPKVISVPGIRELPLTLECRVIYRRPQDIALLSPEDQAKFYPQDVDSTACGANRDAHIAYMGEIVAAYLIR